MITEEKGSGEEGGGALTKSRDDGPDFPGLGSGIDFQELDQATACKDEGERGGKRRCGSPDRFFSPPKAAPPTAFDFYSLT